jgi:hypothetical protein
MTTRCQFATGFVLFSQACITLLLLRFSDRHQLLASEEQQNRKRKKNYELHWLNEAPMRVTCTG